MEKEERKETTCATPGQLARIRSLEDSLRDAVNEAGGALLLFSTVHTGEGLCTRDQRSCGKTDDVIASLVYSLRRHEGMRDLFLIVLKNAMEYGPARDGGEDGEDGGEDGGGGAAESNP